MSARGLESRDPSPEQEQAIGLRDRDVFLEAGAGTGKTRVLVERYCDAVSLDEVPPERILAFTFTERAAAELRHRIRAELSSRAGAAREAGDLGLASALRRAARDSERSWITTIHGFCRRLLATHAAAARMDPRFRVLDESEAARLAERAFADAQSELVAEGDQTVRGLAAGYRPRDLAAHLREAHERLRSQGADPPRLPEPGMPRRSVKEPRKESEALLPAEATAAADGLAAARALLERFHDRYEGLKAERSGADFEDLELRALALLREGPVAAAWRERFEHVMVDEFQDTNRVQLALIDSLRGPATRVFTVGDEFQSIYRFRHADLGVFRRRRHDVEADDDAVSLPLRGNFRARPAVLAAVNALGSALLPGFPPLTAGRPADGEAPGGGPAAELLLTDATGDDRGAGWRAEGVGQLLAPPPGERIPCIVAEARALAERLSGLTAAGVPAGDIVVLLRAFTHVDAYEDALERAGLNPYVVGGRGYWSQQQVEDALRLLGAIANPLDDEVLFGALASPACGATPDALWLLRAAAGRGRHVWPVIAERGWGEGMPHADSERLDAFRDTLLALRDEAPLLPLDSLIDRTLTAFDYDLSLLAKRGGRRRMANVRKLMRLAREFEALEGRDLSGFLALAEEHTVRDEREGQAAIQVEGHDGVRVMTVHAAKGLEFPVVAVADLGRELTRGGGAPMFVLGRLDGDPPDPGPARLGMRLQIPASQTLRLWDLVELERDEREADAAEGLRLVYVAATRAEDRLILSGTFKESQLEPADPAPGDSPLRRLLPALGERMGWAGGDGELALERPLTVAGAPAGGPAPRLRVAVSRPGAERARELRLEGLKPPAAPPPAYGTPPLAGAGARSAGVGHLSYSALASYERCGYRYYVERVVGLTGLDGMLGTDDGDPTDGTGMEADELVEPGDAPAAASVAGRERRVAIGNAVHASLEWSARHGWADPGAARLAVALARGGVAGDPEALELSGSLVAAWLGSAQCERLRGGGWALHPEAPFAVALAGTVVRGKIDLLAEAPGELLVLDYKTDALRGRPPAEAAGGYAIQRDVYALAASAARAGDGGLPPAVSAAYCFLEAPDAPVVEKYDGERLAVAQERVTGLIERIRAGEFRRTEHPERSVCFGCPAAARLCGAPAWRPAA